MLCRTTSQGKCMFALQELKNIKRKKQTADFNKHYFYNKSQLSAKLGFEILQGFEILRTPTCVVSNHINTLN